MVATAELTTVFKLRPFAQGDVAAMVAGMNTESIARDTTIDLPCTAEKTSWWISFINNAATLKPLPEVHFVIEIDGLLAGSIAIINIDGHKGELGYWLLDKYAGRGVMTQVIAQVTKYGLEDLRLARIFAPVLMHNKASMRVLEKNGFMLEGTLKKYYKKHGKYVDALAFARVSGN